MADLYAIAQELSHRFVANSKCQGFGVGKRNGEDILIAYLASQSIKGEILAYIRGKYPDICIEFKNIGKIKLL